MLFLELIQREVNSFNNKNKEQQSHKPTRTTATGRRVWEVEEPGNPVTGNGKLHRLLLVAWRSSHIESFHKDNKDRLLQPFHSICH